MRIAGSDAQYDHSGRSGRHYDAGAGAGSRAEPDAVTFPFTIAVAHCGFLFAGGGVRLCFGHGAEQQHQ
jgi:hypothetical protein